MTSRPPFLDALGRDLVAKRAARIRRQRTRRLAGAGLAALIVASGITWAAVRDDEPSVDRSTVAAPSTTAVAVPSTTEPVVATTTAPTTGWRWYDVPGFRVPGGTDENAALVWADDRVFVWSIDGAWMVDPSTGKIDPAPPPPLEFVSARAAVWTGEEVVIVGGYRPGGSVSPEAVAYSPSEHRWRVLPDSPVDWRIPLASVWTGTEVVFWGGIGSPAPAPKQGAAYNPSTNTWRRIADAPIGLNRGNAVWTGEEIVVVASEVGQWNAPLTPTQYLTYDPDDDTWEVGDPPPLSPQAMWVVWTGESLIAWDYLLGAARLDAATGTWVALPDVPLKSMECTPSGTSYGTTAVISYCGQFAALDPESDSWGIIPKLLEEGRTVEAPDRLLYYGEPGGVLLVKTS